MIVTPPVYTPVHEEETNQLSPVTEEVLRKLVRNSNFLQDLAPVGTIVYVNINQQGGGQPSPLYWQVCDGSEITNPASPLRSIGLNLRYTPNLRDQYPRGAVEVDVNPTGGSQVHNLLHGHTTGPASADGGGLAKKGSKNRRNPHSHTLPTMYGEEDVIDAPAYTYLVAYMKVV